MTEESTSSCRIESSTDLSEAALSELEYRRVATAVLDHIERTVDRWLEDDVIDIDSHRTGGLLELSLPKGSKIIVNLQPPLQEVWLAAQGGGFHYRWSGGQWLENRSSGEFLSALSDHLSRQAGRPLSIEAPV
jgi:CyaY protein